MTVSSTNTKNSYSGDGSTTVFTYNFPINSLAELAVISRSSLGTETTKTLNSDYTIVDNGASGGSVTFSTAPAASETIVLIRDTNLTQTTDYLANDPFPAETHEAALDKLTFQVQEMQEELGRSLKISKTNTMTSTEFTNDATDRALKVFAFDSSGELSVAQELGSFKGNWATATAYKQRDIVKDTSTNNVFFVNTSHNSTGSQPLTTNANAAKYSLIVDAASATTSATNAATSETNAANSATAASASQTAAANSATAAAASETAAGTSETNAATSATNAASSATAAATSATNAATSETNAASSASTATTQASTATTQAGTATTQATNASNSASAASTSETNAASSATAASNSASAASTSETNAATSATNAASSATTASTAATNAANAQAAAEAALDTFDDRFLGNKSTDPSVDNDGNALTDGALYFDTTNNVMKVYDLGTTAWLQLTPTSSNQTNINTLVGIASNITTVANNTTNINAVAGDATDIGTVATNIANVNNVGGSIANVNSVAGNLSGVNSFADRYRIVSSDPTSSLDAGDLAFNTTSSVLKYYDGSSWNQIVAGSMTDLVQDTTPQLGGSLDVNGQSIVSVSNGNIAITPDGSGKVVMDGLSYPTADGTSGQFLSTDGSGNLTFASVPAGVGGANGVDFNDNVKARFGTGNDLEIYHDGSNGIIKQDALTGLEIMADNFRVQNSAGTETLIAADGDGAVSLYHDDVVKAQTSQFGFDLPGDNIELRLGASQDLKVWHDGTNSNILNNTGALKFRSGSYTIRSVDDSTNSIVADTAGAVDLYYNGAIKFSTTSQGVQVSADQRLEIVNGSTWSGELVGKIEHHANNMYHQFNSNFIARNSSGSNVFNVDSSGNGTFNGNVSAYSDYRLKEDVKTIDNALDKVSKLRGVEYTRKETKAREIGVIAQEVKEIIPELVTIENTKSDINPEGLEDLHTMKYANTVGLLIEAIKELKLEIEELKKG